MTDRVQPARHASVCLTVDFDAVSLWMQWGARGIRALSRGEFAATVGVPRLLALFGRRDIQTTWFIPGHTVDTWPRLSAQIAQAGHEIGNHGYLHDSFSDCSPDEIRRVLRKANESIERVTGSRPTGFRLPAGDAPGNLLEILLDEGFQYDSSLNGNDFSPYWGRTADELHDDRGNVLGTGIDIVEMPFVVAVNDFPHFESNYGSPTLYGHDAPSSVEEIFFAEFDYMYDHAGGTLTATCHPQSIGHGMRIAMLDRWIEHCLARPGTRFLRLDAAADEFRAAQRASTAAISEGVDSP